MKASIKKVLKLYKYLLLIFSVLFWIYMIIDDYVFIEKYGSEHWLEYLGIWALYYMLYFLAFSVYYWLGAMLLLLIYHKLIKKNTENQNPDLK